MQKIETMSEFNQLASEEQDTIFRLVRNLMFINGLTKTIIDAPNSNKRSMAETMESVLDHSNKVVGECHQKLVADPSQELILELMAIEAKRLM